MRGAALLLLLVLVGCAPLSAHYSGKLPSDPYLVRWTQSSPF